MTCIYLLRNTWRVRRSFIFDISLSISRFLRKQHRDEEVNIVYIWCESRRAQRNEPPTNVEKVGWKMIQLMSNGWNKANYHQQRNPCKSKYRYIWYEYMFCLNLSFFGIKLSYVYRPFLFLYMHSLYLNNPSQDSMYVAFVMVLLYFLYIDDVHFLEIKLKKKRLSF